MTYSLSIGYSSTKERYFSTLQSKLYERSREGTHPKTPEEISPMLGGPVWGTSAEEVD